MHRLRSVSRWTLAVLVVLAAVSVGGWALIRHSVGRQDRALLENDAGQINVLLQTALQNAQTQLRGIAFFTSSSGYSPQVFAEQAKPLLTSPVASVALVDISAGSPRVVLAAGNGLRQGQPLPAPLARAVMGAGVPLSSGIVRSGGQTVLYLGSTPTTNPKLVALETTVLNPRRPSPNASGPYSHVYVNVYDGPAARPDRLIVTTFGPAPLPGPLGTATTRVGSATWLVQVSAKTSPSGAYAEASPWIALAVGGAVAIGLAALVERLGRRRGQAERLAVHLDRVAEENRRLYSEQRTVAETLQLSLLPAALPELTAAETAVRFLPGVKEVHVGGDWYDIIALDDSHILLAVGDVSGRGLGAAGVMASLLHATRAYAAQGDAPAVMLSKLSRLLSVERGGQFATVLFVLVDLAAHQLTVVNAGHLPPLLLHDGEGDFIETDIGLPVGVSPAASYHPVTVPAPADGTLLAFTDGLVERRGEILDIGLKRLRDAATLDDAASLEGLLSSVVEGLVGSGADDDTVLLGIRWRT